MLGTKSSVLSSINIEIMTTTYASTQQSSPLLPLAPTPSMVAATTTSTAAAATAPTPALRGMRRALAQPVFASFLAGGVAGAVSRTVVSPLERLKILFQVQSAGRTEYKMSVPKALGKMWREEGWRGLMAGNGTNCIRIVPYSAVQFGAYNFYRRVSQLMFL